MLVFEQAHYEATGVFCLSTPDGSQAYCFDDALEAKRFVDFYYKNPFAATFAYHNARRNKGEGIADMAGV